MGFHHLGGPLLKLSQPQSLITSLVKVKVKVRVRVKVSYLVKLLCVKFVYFLVWWS